MEKEEILQYNKMCAGFLGYVYVSSLDVKEGKYHSSIIAGWYKKVPGIYLPRLNFHLYIGRNHFDLKFDSDWNWIHEVVDTINKLPQFNDWWLNTKFNSMRECIKIKLGLSNSNKEAVINAINQFLIWYNEKAN